MTRPGRAPVRGKFVPCYGTNLTRARRGRARVKFVSEIGPTMRFGHAPIGSADS
jgi:hypothetical protein